MTVCKLSYSDTEVLYFYFKPDIWYTNIFSDPGFL